MLNKKYPQGFSLIEVLIALSILAAGLLGMTAMQNEALHYTHAAFTDSQAQFLLDDISERIRANAGNSSYSISYSQTSPTSAVDCSSSSCSSVQMANWDIKQWRENVENSSYLSGGESQIVFNSAEQTFEISIRYDWRALGQEIIHGQQRNISVTIRVE